MQREKIVSTLKQLDHKGFTTVEWEEICEMISIQIENKGKIWSDELAVIGKLFVAIKNECEQIQQHMLNDKSKRKKNMQR